jgi:hypothetical protein
VLSKPCNSIIDNGKSLDSWPKSTLYIFMTDTMIIEFSSKLCFFSGHQCILLLCWCIMAIMDLLLHIFLSSNGAIAMNGMLDSARYWYQEAL